MSTSWEPMIPDIYQFTSSYVPSFYGRPFGMAYEQNLTWPERTRCFCWKHYYRVRSREVTRSATPCTTKEKPRSFRIWYDEWPQLLQIVATVSVCVVAFTPMKLALPRRSKKFTPRSNILQVNCNLQEFASLEVSSQTPVLILLLCFLV